MAPKFSRFSGPWRAEDSHRRVRILCDPTPKSRTLGYTAPLAHTKSRTLWRRTAKMSNPGVHHTRRYAKISNPLAPNAENLEPSSARDPGSAKKSNPASENPARRATTHKLRKPKKMTTTEQQNSPLFLPPKFSRFSGNPAAGQDWEACGTFLFNKKKGIPYEAFYD